MKADLRRLPQLLRDLARIRVICLYGNDRDAIRDTARRVVIAEAGTADDPFRVTECAGDDREVLSAALASPSLIGGRIVVWVRHANERVLPVVERALEEQIALLVIEYGDPSPKSRLRAALEKHPYGCTVACTRRASDASEAIRSVLAEMSVAADAGVIAALAAEADRQGCSGRAIGETAALYAGHGGQLAPRDVAELSGTASADGLDRGLLAGLRGDAPALDAALSALFEDGTAPIAVLRAALFQVQRLRTMATLPADARWAPDDLMRAADTVWAAERRSKATGVPQEALCRAVLLHLARVAAAR